jgi:hypothetical protein
MLFPAVDTRRASGILQEVAAIKIDLWRRCLQFPAIPTSVTLTVLPPHH